MVVTFFDEKDNKFRQIEGNGNETALLISVIGDTHTITTTREKDFNNHIPIPVVIGETYSIDIETSSGKIELPKIGDNDFCIKVIDYVKGQFIEFEHIESL